MITLSFYKTYPTYPCVTTQFTYYYIYQGKSVLAIRVGKCPIAIRARHSVSENRKCPCYWGRTLHLLGGDVSLLLRLDAKVIRM